MQFIGSTQTELATNALAKSLLSNLFSSVKISVTKNVLSNYNANSIQDNAVHCVSASVSFR